MTEPLASEARRAHLALVEAPAASPVDDGRPRVAVARLHRVTTEEAWAAVGRAGPPTCFRGPGDQLVTIALEEGEPRVRPLSLPGFRAWLDGVIACERHRADGVAPCYPPLELATMMYHDPDPPAPILRGVISAPVYAADGTLRTSEGYDPRDGLYLALAFRPRVVPSAPTDQDIAEARRLLLEELLGEFPFAAPGDAAAAVGLLVLPLVRALIDGPTPLHLIEAPTPGTGKSLLARVVLGPGIGLAGVASLSLPDEDAELRKVLTTHILAGRRALILDNVTRSMRSAVLAQALTGVAWTDRRLGGNTAITAPLTMLWAATANNPQLSDELTRRVVPIRLIPADERPEDRTGFRHPELERWAAAERAALVWAGQVLVARWLARGRPGPAPGTPDLGSYEAHRRVIGGILTAAEIGGWLTNRERLRAHSDPDTERWRGFVAAWAARWGVVAVSAAELLATADECEIPVRGESDRARITSLGSLLGSRRDRIYGEYRIEPGPGRDRRKWRLVAVTPRATCDTSLHPTLRATQEEEEGTGRGVTGGHGVTNPSPWPDGDGEEGVTGDTGDTPAAIDPDQAARDAQAEGA